MTIHSSLKITRGKGGQRTVFTRMERILALKKQGRWKDGDKVVGLPKVRTRFKTKVKKKAAAEAAPAGEAAPVAAGVEAAKAEPAKAGAVKAAPAKPAAPAKETKREGKKDAR